jgi:hypothetical protein
VRIANIGIAAIIIEFRRVSLPMYVSKEDTPDIILSNLETIGMRSATEVY